MSKPHRLAATLVAAALTTLAFAAGPTTRQTFVDTATGRMLRISLPTTWLAVEGDIPGGPGRNFRFYSRDEGRPIMLEVTGEDAWQSLTDDMLQQRLQNHLQKKTARLARVTQDKTRTPDTQPAPVLTPFGRPATGYYVTRHGVEGTSKQYPAATDFAFRLDHGVLIGRLLHQAESRQINWILQSLSTAELSDPAGRQATTNRAPNQPSILRMHADESGEAFAIDAPAFKGAEPRHFDRMGFGGQLVLGPSISLGYATSVNAGYKDALEFRASDWVSVERTHARLRNPTSRLQAFPPATPYTDSGDGHLAIREVRTDFVTAVYAYLIDGDTAVSMRITAHRKNGEDLAEMLRIARSARIERGFPKTQHTNRRRPQTAPATSRPVSGPPDKISFDNFNAVSTVVLDVPWTMRRTNPLQARSDPWPSAVRTRNISPRLNCTVDWGFGMFDGPATEARDRDWTRRQAATRAATVPSTAPALKLTDSGDKRLAIKIIESAAGRSVIGYLIHEGEVIQIKLQSTSPIPVDGEDDLQTMVRIVGSARVTQVAKTIPQAAQPATRPAGRATP